MTSRDGSETALAPVTERSQCVTINLLWMVGVAMFLMIVLVDDNHATSKLLSLSTAANSSSSENIDSTITPIVDILNKKFSNDATSEIPSSRANLDSINTQLQNASPAQPKSPGLRARPVSPVMVDSMASQRSSASSVYGPFPPCAGPCDVCMVPVEVVTTTAWAPCPVTKAAAPCKHWVVVRAGLGTRMRVITTYLAAARFMGCHLTVYWSRLGANSHDDFPRFDELFEVPAAPVTYNIHPQTAAIFPLLGTLALRVFRPLPAILVRVEQLLVALGPAFVALHIRRTDKNTLYNVDAELAAWTQLFPDSKVFVAADNELSLATMRKALSPGRVVAQDNFIVHTAVTSKQKSGASEPRSTIVNAVVDMWTASFAAHFRGTLTSSYSVIIQLLRTAREPGGEPAIDAWAINCADQLGFGEISPIPPWMKSRVGWPNGLTFTTVSAIYKDRGDCQEYSPNMLEQPELM